MFGTIAKLRIKDGAESPFEAWARALVVPVAGHVATTLYRSTDDAHVFWLAVLFTDEAAYRANAESPEQYRRWQQLRSLLEADPEWHDGDVLFHGSKPADVTPFPPPRTA